MQKIQRIIRTTTIAALTLLLPLAASAQSFEEIRDLSPEDRKAYMESMSDEERTAMREKWHAEYENLTDEEKQALRKERGANREARRAEMRERWASMSEEERAAAREKRHDKKGRKGGHHPNRHKNDDAVTASDGASDAEQ